jgi:hypothetical protein
MQDNAGVVSTISNISVNNKALLSMSRMVNHLRGLVAAQVIRPVKVTAEQMGANGLTKIITSPTLLWYKEAPPILGEHPTIGVIQRRVSLLYNKRLTAEQKRDLETPEYMAHESADHMAMAAITRCQETPAWLSSTRPPTKRMMQKFGLLATQPEEEEPTVVNTMTAMVDVLPTTVAESMEKDEVCLPERLRRALMKLTPDERLLFSTRWRGDGLGDAIKVAESQHTERTPIPVVQPIKTLKPINMDATKKRKNRGARYRLKSRQRATQFRDQPTNYTSELGLNSTPSIARQKNET